MSKSLNQLTKKQLIEQINIIIKDYEKIYDTLDKTESHSYQLGFTQTNRKNLIRDIKGLIEQ